MDPLTLYITGPIFAFGLPLAVVIAGVVAGRKTPMTRDAWARSLLALGIASALAVPSTTPISGSSNWITVWWIAAARGPYEISLFLFACIAGMSVGAALLEGALRAALGRMRPPDVSAERPLDVRR